MRSELSSWVRFIRFLLLWCFCFWAWSSLLTGFASFCAMPKGPVLDALIWIAVVFFLAPSSTKMFERKFFGHSPMYDSPKDDETGRYGQSNVPPVRTVTTVRPFPPVPTAEELQKARDAQNARDAWEAYIRDSRQSPDDPWI